MVACLFERSACLHMQFDSRLLFGTQCSGLHVPFVSLMRLKCGLVYVTQHEDVVESKGGEM